VRFHLLTAAAIVALSAQTAFAQFDKPGATDTKGPRLGKEQTQRYKAGLTVRASGGPCAGLYGTVPVPTDWPEQKVKIVGEDVSPSVRSVRYRTLYGTVKQMQVTIPTLRSGQTARAVITFEVEKKAILPPADPGVFVMPEKVDAAVRRYLGPSPYIESTHAEIRSLAKKVVADKEKAWDKVEAIYDYVRDNVEYKNGKLKGALAALRDGTGDCEELTSLFIALCRANDIPARTVWIPGHCYPEFYLHDDEGKGHWIPCQAAGTREFGGMSDFRPILQKGDNFKVPEKRERQRYVAEFLKGKAIRGGGDPRVTFIRE